MDAIKTYVDNVFTAFPQTEDVLTLKREMLMGMEEKYFELKRENKSEHEAVGTVISNFGNINEIAAELGIDLTGGEFAHKEESAASEKFGRSKKDRKTLTLTEDEAFEYLRTFRRGGALTGVGAWLILTGVGMMLWIFSWGFTGFGLLILMAGIAAGVACFITSGIRMAPFEHYAKHKILLPTHVREDLEYLNRRFMPQFGAKIASGVAGILLSVGLFLFLSSISGGAFSLTVMLSGIGFSVFLFISSSVTKGAFDVLLKKS